MKIQFGYGIEKVPAKVKSNAAVKKNSVEKSGVFDEIMVSTRDMRSSSEVIDGMKKQIAADISASTPISDLNDIKLQIAKGSYDASAVKITNKLLFDIV